MIEMEVEETVDESESQKTRKTARIWKVTSRVVGWLVRIFQLLYAATILTLVIVFHALLSPGLHLARANPARVCVCCFAWRVELAG